MPQSYIPCTPTDPRVIEVLTPDQLTTEIMLFACLRHFGDEPGHRHLLTATPQEMLSIAHKHYKLAKLESPGTAAHELFTWEEVRCNMLTEYLRQREAYKHLLPTKGP